MEIDHDDTEMKLSYLCLAILAVALWGFNFVFAKMALAELPLFTMMTLRFLIVGCVLLPFYRKPPASISYLALIGFIFAVPHSAASFGGMVVGLGAGMATLVEQTNAPFLLLINAIVFKEKIGRRSLIGMVLSFIGTYFLMQAPDSIDAPLGFTLVLCGAFFWGIYSLLLKRMDDAPPLAIICWLSLLAAPQTALLSLFTESHQWQAIAGASITSWCVMVYMVIGVSIGAHGLWCYLLSCMPIGQLAPTTLLVPLFGMFGGVLFLNEALSVQMVAGAALMMVGIGIILIRRPKQRQEVDFS